MSSNPIVSAGLDLGTTRIKCALLDADGRLRQIESAAAPGLSGDDLVRESDPILYADRAANLLKSVVPAGTDVPVGIASQRSSFLLWERDSGTPVTPLISWQDRRAAAWCDQHAEHAVRIKAVTGLPLSPHYLGPKLAVTLEAHPEFRRQLAAGDLCAGTLDTWVLWRWTAGTSFQTDVSMAARTLLADPKTGQWSPELMQIFQVPETALPHITTTTDLNVRLESGLRISASVADQSAGLVGVTGGRTDTVLVNFGTGTFVLRPTGRDMLLIPGYLSGPLFSDTDHTRFLMEGTINGGGADADRHSREAVTLKTEEPVPEVFCLPDNAGTGAPHWRPNLQTTFSSDISGLPGAERRRIFLQGLVFRVCEILNDLSATGSDTRILVGGGLARAPFISAALAACLERPVEIISEPEATLVGAAMLAGGVADSPCRSEPVTPAAAGNYLPARYLRWREWLAGVIANS